MQVAHIGAGSGSFIRVDDRRQVICLCPLLHSLHVSSRLRTPTIKIGGQHWPTIDTANAIWIKQQFDPDFYDPDFMERTWKRKPPLPEPLDHQWIKSLRDNVGMRIT